MHKVGTSPLGEGKGVGGGGGGVGWVGGIEDKEMGKEGEGGKER